MSILTIKRAISRYKELYNLDIEGRFLQGEGGYIFINGKKTVISHPCPLSKLARELYKRFHSPVAPIYNNRGNKPLKVYHEPKPRLNFIDSILKKEAVI